MSREELTCGEVDQFLTVCGQDMKRYPRSPILVSKQAAKDIDMSGIMKMSPEQIDEALRLMSNAA
jgi:hypothetical protein